MKQLTLPESDSPPMHDHVHTKITPVRAMSTAAAPPRPSAAAAAPPRPSLTSRPALLRRRSSIEVIELETTPEALAPKVEGRIYIIDEQVQCCITSVKCFFCNL